MSPLKEMKSIFWFKAISCSADHKTMLILATVQWQQSTRRSGETGEAINPHFGDGHWGVTSWLPQDGAGSNSRQSRRRGIIKSCLKTQPWPSGRSSGLTGRLPESKVHIRTRHRFPRPADPPTDSPCTWDDYHRHVHSSVPPADGFPVSCGSFGSFVLQSEVVLMMSGPFLSLGGVDFI